jgi:hypothetical protein
MTSCRDGLEAALGVGLAPPGSAGAVALARRLADEIDGTRDPDVVARLALRLLAVLRALGLAETTAPAEPGGRSPLDELRARREAR